MNLGRNLTHFKDGDEVREEGQCANPPFAGKGLLGEALIFAISPWLVYAIALLAFYPAVMTIDSLDQWIQINYQVYTDWHPPLHTLLMGLLRKVWDSPAMVASCQALAMGGAIGILVAVVRRATGVALSAGLGGSLIVAIFPLSFVMTVTLWKDVFYSAAVLAMTAGAVAMVCLGKRPLSSLFGFTIALVIAVACMTFRHNGPPVALVLVAFVVIFAPAQRIISVAFLLTSCVVAGLCQGPAMDAIGIKRTHASVALLAHHIAAHLAAGTEPTSESERHLLSSIKPDGWGYNCASVNYTIFADGFDLEAAKQHRGELFSIWWEMARAHPGTELRHLLCVSSLVWNPVQTGSGYLYTVGVIPDEAHTRWISPNDLGLHESYPLGRTGAVIRNVAFRFVDVTWLVRPAAYLYFLLAACIAVMLVSNRNARKAAICVLVAALAQSAPLLFASVAQDARYQLPIYIMSLSLLPVLLGAVWRGYNATRPRGCFNPFGSRQGGATL